MDLSQDKAVNVRIALAEAFFQFYKSYETLDIELGKKNITAGRQS